MGGHGKRGLDVHASGHDGCHAESALVGDLGLLNGQHTLIETNLDGLKKLADELLERETLITEDIEAILGPRPQTSPIS